MINFKDCNGHEIKSGFYDISKVVNNTTESPNAASDNERLVNEVYHSILENKPFDRTVLRNFHDVSYTFNGASKTISMTEKIPVVNYDAVLVWSINNIDNVIVRTYNANRDLIKSCESEITESWKGCIMIKVSGAKYIEVADVPFRLINTSYINLLSIPDSNDITYNGYIDTTHTLGDTIWKTWVYPYIGNGIYIKRDTQDKYVICLFADGKRVYSAETKKIINIDAETIKTYGNVSAFTISQLVNENEPDPQIYISKNAQKQFFEVKDSIGFESRFKDQIIDFENLPKPSYHNLLNQNISPDAVYHHVRSQEDFNTLWNGTNTVVNTELKSSDVVVVFHEGVYTCDRQHRIIIKDVTSNFGLWIKANDGDDVRIIPYDTILKKENAESLYTNHWCISNPLKDLSTWEGFKPTDMITSKFERIKETYVNDVINDGDIYCTGAFELVSTSGSTKEYKAKLPSDIKPYIPDGEYADAFIYYTSSYTPRLERVTKVENGYVHFNTIGDPDFDYSFSRKFDVRFKLINFPDILGKGTYLYNDGKFYFPNEYEEVYVGHYNCSRFIDTDNLSIRILCVDGLKFIGAPRTSGMYYDLLYFRRTNNVVVVNCLFSGIMKYKCISSGITYNGSQNADDVLTDMNSGFVVMDCEFNDVFSRGVGLKQQDTVVTKCTFHDAMELSYGQSGGMIAVGAVNSLVSNNKVWNYFNTAIRWGCCDDVSPMIVENNEIWNDYAHKLKHDRLSLMDFGAIYGYNSSNVIIRYNYIHDVQGKYAGCGLYLDGGAWNIKCYGNIILHCPALMGYNYQKARSGEDDLEVRNPKWDTKNFFVNNILDGGYRMQSVILESENYCGANLFIKQKSDMSILQSDRRKIDHQEDDYFSKSTTIEDGIIYSKTKLPDYLGGLLRKVWRTIG